MSARIANRRIRMLLGLFVVVFAGVLARAVWLQAVQAGTLEEMALRQHRETDTIPAGRGTIYDRTGEPLAIGEQATTVFADPRQVKDARAVAVAAAKILRVDPNELYPQLRDRSRRFVFIKRKAEPEDAAELRRENLAGVGFYSEERRTYPQRSVAAHVLGFAGIDNDGLDGLEKRLDPELKGKPGSRTIVRDPIGRAIDVVEVRPERQGDDVFLTIDRRMQANAEEVLRATVNEWGALGGHAIVLEPQTGRVLAMAVAPTFDANNFGNVPPERRKNRAVTDVFEPGSTFKIVTVAGALSEKLVTPRTRFTLAPSIKVADREISEPEPRGTRPMSVAQILSNSSNVGTITLAQLLTKTDVGVSGWIERFGFGKRTGVELPGESPGIVLPLERWSGSTIGNLPLGQGISVTGLQMAAAYGAIANEGVLRRPRVVERVGSRRTRAGSGRRIVSRTVAAQMMTMLRDVVTAEGGTGALAAIPNYTVAGKTGTAAKPERGGYSTSRYVASFIGVVPAKDPRLVVLVAIDEPRGAIWGGVVAAPAFAEIASFGLQYLEIAPDAPQRR